jgi:hypothetical protein
MREIHSWVAPELSEAHGRSQRVGSPHRNSAGRGESTSLVLAEPKAHTGR